MLLFLDQSEAALVRIRLSSLAGDGTVLGQRADQILQRMRDDQPAAGANGCPDCSGLIREHTRVALWPVALIDALTHHTPIPRDPTGHGAHEVIEGLVFDGLRRTTKLIAWAQGADLRADQRSRLVAILNTATPAGERASHG